MRNSALQFLLVSLLLVLLLLNGNERRWLEFGCLCVLNFTSESLSFVLFIIYILRMRSEKKWAQNSRARKNNKIIMKQYLVLNLVGATVFYIEIINKRARTEGVCVWERESAAGLNDLILVVDRGKRENRKNQTV